MIPTRALALLLLTTSTAQAGVTIVTARQKGSTTTIYLEGDKARVEPPSRGPRSGVVLIDAAARKLTILNDSEKSYVELTEADRQRFKQQVAVVREQVKARLQSLPPEQRKKAEAMMGGSLDETSAAKEPPSTFEALGTKKTVNGFACQMYRRLEGGKLREELCVAPWGAATVQRADFAPIQTFAKSFIDEMGAGSRQSSRLLGALDQYPGLPISRVPIDEAGQRGEEEQVKTIQRGSIPAGKFSVPTDYKKRDLPGPPPRK
jgi:hypothetical protein